MYEQRNIRTLAFAAVKSNFVEARRTLFSELLDMCWCAKATAISCPPLFVRLSGRNTACGKAPGCPIPAATTMILRTAVSPPPGYGRKW
jgi:hypothetical protein